MQDAGLANAEVIAWICFVLGAIVLLVGLYIGLITAPAKAKEASEQKIAEAKANIARTTEQLEAASSGLEAATVGARETAEAAKSALEQVGGLVGSLPEHQRFPGMLVLIGAVLMSVGTIQFGGTSIF